MPNSQAIEKLQKARSLLTEVERSLASGEGQTVERQSRVGGDSNSNPTGIFDGQFLVTKDGKKYQVPPNYASKSRLVAGDRLELVNEAGDAEGSQNFVKTLTKVARTEVEGILTKKDYQWAVVTEENTYWVLPASVEYYDGKIGDKVKLILPADYEGREDVEWGAVEEIIKDRESGISLPAGRLTGEAGNQEPREGSRAENEKQGLSGEIVLEDTRKSAEGENRGKDAQEGRLSLVDGDVEELR